jgi:hypothetical protein
MKGLIHAYSAAVNAGVINGDDGIRYSFGKTDWQHDRLPANDAAVEFTADGKRAVKVSRDET